MKGSEVSLCAAVRQWLMGKGWRVYSEVNFRGVTADLVALKTAVPLNWSPRQGVSAGDGQPLIWVIEAKIGPSLRLLCQGSRWRAHCHRVSLAIAARADVETPEFAFFHQVADWQLMGILLVGRSSVTELSAPATIETDASLDLLPHLHAEQLDFAPAGNAEGKRFTKYQEVRQQLAEYIVEHATDRGLSLRQLLAAVPTPWGRDARQRVIEIARSGKLAGVRAERSGGRWRFWPAEVEGA